MAYDLPVDGELNWDVKLNASIEAVKATADGATADLATHEADVANPHAVTKTQVGLGSVDNTSDADKPVSTATQAALDLKVARGSQVYAADDYADLATAVAALTAGSTLVLNPGTTYSVNATIAPAVDDITIDGRGAKVRLGAATTGTASTDDRIFYLSGTNQRIVNVSFVTREGGSNSATAIAANVRLDGTANRVTDCRFSTGSNQAVFVGVGSDHHVSRNYVTGGSGIIYGWGSVKRTTCAHNTLISPAGTTYGALEGNGNSGGSLYVEDCLVIGNLIVGAADIGIQDQVNTRGTIIRDNHVINPGSMGISAVGEGSLVQGNVVEDPSITSYGIEVFANGQVVSGNRVSYRTKTPTTGAGIMVSSGTEGVAIVGNSVEDAAIAIQTAASVPGVAVTNNTLINPTARGILPAGSEPVVVSGNIFRFTEPATQTRYGITPNAAGSMITGNCFIYTSGSGGGSFQDYAITLNVASLGVVGNTVTGGGRADSFRPKVAATVSTANVLISSNVVRNGAVLDSSTNLTTPVVANNVTA